MKRVFLEKKDKSNTQSESSFGEFAAFFIVALGYTTILARSVSELPSSHSQPHINLETTESVNNSQR